MIADILLFSRIATTRYVNGFLYFLQKIPLLGKHISDRFYSLVKVKNVLSIIVWVFRILYTLCKSGLYMGIFIALPLTLINFESSFQYFTNNVLFGFLIFTGLLGSTQNGKLLAATADMYTMVKHMHMSSRRFLLHNAMYCYGMNVIGIITGMLPFSFFYGFPWWYALVAGVIYLGTHLGFEAFHIRLFTKYHKFVCNQTIVRTICYILSLGLVYGSFALQFEWSFATTLFLVIGALSVPVLIFSIRYIQTYPAYPDVINELLVTYNEVLAITQDKKAMASSGVDLKVDDYSEEELKNNKSELHGYRYLNHLFFQRHIRLIKRPIKRRILIILAVTAVMVVVVYVVKAPIEAENILGLLPPVVFFMYMFTISEKVCRAMFMNCDVSLLHYGYYRQPSAILENFRIRMKALCFYNLQVTIVLMLCLNFCFAIMQINFTWMELLLFDLALLSLSIFFSIHYLFAYYIFQPYNAEFAMKNPFFSLLNGAVYVACYACLQLTGNFLFVCGVLTATVLYMIIALILVYRLAPKTFHLK